MKYIFDPGVLDHLTGNHPENPKRLERLRTLPITEVPIDVDPVYLIHPKSYVDRIQRAAENELPLDPDTRLSKTSFSAALKAVNATILASEQQGFAIVRPPGHHAYPEEATGFCIFNNVAIAAERLVQQGKRVLIFDFDGHYGDGTAHIFYHTDQVLYWSLHQYPAFPMKGKVNEIGGGPGKGYTVNVPLPPDAGDDIFMHAIDHFLPIAKQFKPDVVAVSAGFDAHLYDLLLQLRVSAGTFYKIGQILRENFDNVFATLEGGYNINEIAKCVENFHAGMNNLPMPHDETVTSSRHQVWQEYEINCHTALALLRPYWDV
ncbi:MAG: histone deacetylase [Saprospiraceae bacterium]|nr:histone deacetylase [Saprospiraceae bacterium]